MSAPESFPVRPRVAVANRADGGVIYWLGKLYGFAALVVIAALMLAAVITYRTVSNSAPPSCWALANAPSPACQICCADAATASTEERGCKTR